MFSGIIDQLSYGLGGRLQYLYVSLSNVCNARCPYCDVHQAPAPTRTFGRSALESLFGEARALGCRTIHLLGGGEPLIDPHFPAAVEVCTGLGLDLVITTNGSHLTSRTPLLRNASLKAVLLSLDSHVPEIHDLVRGIPGLWRRAAEGVAACRRELPHVKLVLNHVVTRNNIRALEDFLQVAQSLSADAVNLIPVKDSPVLEASADQKSDLDGRMLRLQTSARQHGIDLLLDLEDASAWAEPRGCSSPAREYRCVFPEHALYVDFATGDVFPCDCTVHRKPEERFRTGNIWGQPLSDIWNGEPIRELRTILRSPCDPGCKTDCDWNNRRTNRRLLSLEGAAAAGPLGAPSLAWTLSSHELVK